MGPLNFGVGQRNGVGSVGRNFGVGGVVQKICVGPNFGIGQENDLCRKKKWSESKKFFFMSLWFRCLAILSYSTEITVLCRLSGPAEVGGKGATVLQFLETLKIAILS